MDHEWVSGAAEGSPAPDEWPVRLTTAVTAVAGTGPGELLLVNPHPDSWNNWQLPYASYSSQNDTTQTGSFTELERLLRAASDVSAPEVIKTAEKDISASLGTHVSLEPANELETFALRFSKTAGVWTGYRFIYLGARLAGPPSTLTPTYLDLVGDGLAGAVANRSLEGVALSDNVWELLRDPRLLAALKGLLRQAPRGA